MKNQDESGEGVGVGSGRLMSLQSRAEIIGEVGDPGEKIPTGTRSRLWNAQRMLAS